MKRVCVIILSIILCVSTMVSISSAEEKNDITFRDIPWESSIEDTIKHIKKEFGNKIEIESDFRARSIGELEYCELFIYNIKVPNLKVAGFPVTGEYSSSPNIILYFLPELTEDQSSYSTTKGKFIGACYTYIHDDNMSFESLSDELERKITNIYGSPSTNYGDWNKEWKVNDTYIIGAPVETSVEVASSGFVRISKYMPTGCSLLYCYQPDSIIAESKLIDEIKDRAEQEEWEKKQKEEEERKRKEEEDRGDEGL